MAEPGVRADVGVLGDRILAVGDLSDVDVDVGRDGRRLHGPDRGARGSSIRTGTRTARCSWTAPSPAISTRATRPSCPATAATPSPRSPIPAASSSSWRSARHGLVARWGTFAEYLDRVEEAALGPNVAFLVGHGTVRGSVMGAEARPPDRRRARGDGRARSRPPSTRARSGCRPGSSTRRACTPRPGRGGGPRHGDGTARRPVRDAHAQRERRAVRRRWTNRSRRSARRARRRASRSRTSSAARTRSGARPARRSRGSRRPGPRASTWPPTSTRTRRPRRPSRRSCPPASRASASTRAWRRSPTRTSATSSAREIERGISGWENVAADPGWHGLRDLVRGQPSGVGRPLAGRAGDELDADPADLAFDALVDDRLDVSVVIDCMSEPDVETIMAVPWIAVCTDAEGRRPGHPILDAGRPHPRTYGSTARVLGTLRARARRSCRSRRRSRS